MAILGALVLVVFLLIRPMEIVPAIAQLRPLEVLTLFIALGVTWDVLVRRRRLVLSPQVPWLIAFLGWSFAVTIAKLGKEGFGVAWATITLAAIFMVLVGLAAVTRERLRALAAVLVACLATISVVAVHQGVQPPQCIEVRDEPGEGEEWTPDGRECEGARACENNGRPDVDYVCERVGMLGTFSTGRRVRYRGQLADPNELSVFVGAVLPFLFLLTGAPGARGARGALGRALSIAPIVAVSLGAVVLAQSRSGQIVLGTIALVAFVRRYGAAGSIVAAAVSLPVVLLSWREGAEADASSLERATILFEGIDLVRAHPLLGVGVAQFVHEISIPFTAHNSYLLVAAELGLPGLLLWSGLLWSSLKIAVEVAERPPPGLDPQLQRFAEALAISLLGVFVGVYFLSFSYKQLLFVWLGLAFALHGAVRAQAPDFRVTMTRRDLLGIAAFSLAILASVWIVSRAGVAG
ncbi:MAG: O-antigen ligase family protein [Deltaproteobacteria bacterium]|nr:O-antigen ligase family protein [Deltaproteobacteria bacterium]